MTTVLRLACVRPGSFEEMVHQSISTVVVVAAVVVVVVILVLSLTRFSLL